MTTAAAAATTRTVFTKVDARQVDFTLPNGETGIIEKVRAGYGDLQWIIHLETGESDVTGMGSYTYLDAAKRDIKAMFDNK